MTTPLLMLGPGGSFNTRYDVKGKSLVKSRTTAPEGHDADGESAGGLAAWARLRGREDAVDNPADRRRRRQPDSFEHHDPAPTPTYAQPGKPGSQQKLALLHALVNWMEVQGQSLDELDDANAVLATAVRHATQPGPAVRLIRWNGGTLDLPTAAPVFAGRSHPGQSIDLATFPASRQPEPDSPTNDAPTNAALRSPQHDHPQPHAQADEDPHHDPRVSAEPWLFADHAGTGGRTGRLQGHRLRTRRGAHQKGLPHPRPQQGALFGVVA